MGEHTDPPPNEPIALQVPDRFALGLMTLVVGACAFAIAATTTIVYDVPPPWRTPTPKLEGQKVVEFKGVKLAWGGKPVVDAKPTIDTPRALLVGSMVAAVMGLVVGSVAWWREGHLALVGPGMAMCAVALSWQYIAAGIVAGVAAAVFLWVLSKLPA